MKTCCSLGHSGLGLRQTRCHAVQTFGSIITQLNVFYMKRSVLSQRQNINEKENLTKVKDFSGLAHGQYFLGQNYYFEPMV